MKSSLIIVGFFCLGILVGYLNFTPKFLIEHDLSMYALYALILLVGIVVGADAKSWKLLLHAKLRVVLVPIGTVVGTLLGVSVVAFIWKGISLKEAAAVGSGFGYYSLSSILIGKMYSESLGIVALIANISREIMTLLLAPVMVKYFGKIAPISSGGATSMDTTLPIITRYSGHEYAIISIFHGTVLTVLVPILVPFIINL